MSTQLLIAALVAGSVYVLIALCLNLVYGTMRLINVAYDEVVMIGAHVIYWACRCFRSSFRRRYGTWLTKNMGFCHSPSSLYWHVYNP
jgi:branched-subunit amino acid ABC-type transport system permease component